MSCRDRARRRTTKWRIDLAIHGAIEVARKRSVADSFKQLLTTVLSRSELLRPQSDTGRPGWLRAELCLRALLALSGYARDWMRDPADYSSVRVSALEQFGALARHLLAACAVPWFMTLVWFEEPGARARRHQTLFKHLGRGNSIRGAKTPIRLTKEMARCFSHAPDHLSVEQALRWSQVRGMGGSRALAASITGTHLGDAFEHEAFWSAIIRFLIADPAGANLARPLIGFLDENDYAPSSDSSLTLDEIEPLREQAIGWEHENSSTKLRRWERTSIGGFVYMEPQTNRWSAKQWTIRELTDETELRVEGRKLRHCVAMYADACERRTTSIWSLQRHGSLTSQHVLTIEVEPKHRRIVTARGMCNSSPRPDARHVMEMWAHKEGLTIAASV